MRCDACDRRSAFTLVELLVVIAIIGILVALLLPAIQAAREAARRASCSNNLKNLSLAVLNHHDVMKHFPVNMGFMDGIGAIEAPGREQPGVGWILNTLPQLEEQALYDQFKAGGAFEGSYRDRICRAPKVNQGLGSIKNGISVPELAKTQLSVLQCPSDPSVQQLRDDQWQWNGPCMVALTSYKGVLDDAWVNELGGGTFRNDIPAEYKSGNYKEPAPGGWTTDRDCSRDTRCRGIFFRQSYQRPVRIGSVTDGTSKTLMIGEDVPEYNHHSVAYFSNGSWCACNTPLNYGLGQNPDTFAAAWWDAQGFRSKHPGGVHFALADGSVRFIAENVDFVFYRTSCTRNGAESATGEL
jgi:prepilin-type N-terminal cleavage/methylation domain-containing protein/prepilin-type processing-associated H-X9-DG protein